MKGLYQDEKKRGNSVEKFNALTKKIKNRKFYDKGTTNTGH